jgi:type IV fimbrial biogenesis protein FimT
MIKKIIGLTLLECIIVMALSCILLFSAIIAYQSFVCKNQLLSLVNQFTDALLFARDEAITLQTTVTFCPKNKDEKCGFDWEKGQLILNSKKIIRELPATPIIYHVYFSGTLGESTVLRWRADGFTRGQQGSFYFCDLKKHPAASAQIIILRTGRLRVVMGKIAGCD